MLLVAFILATVAPVCYIGASCIGDIGISGQTENLLSIGQVELLSRNQPVIGFLGILRFEC